MPGDRAALEGDPEADAVIGQLVRDGQMTMANQVFHAWTRNDQPVPAAAPPVLRDFLERNAVLTAQERETVDRLAHGDTIKLLQSNMEVFTMAEAFGGPFAALADPLLAKSVWYAKYDLVMDIRRRFSRTMNTMWDMLGNNSWDASGNALITLVKLRLAAAGIHRPGPARLRGGPLAEGDAELHDRLTPAGTGRTAPATCRSTGSTADPRECGVDPF